MSSSLAAAILHYSTAIHLPIIIGSNSLVLITFAHVSALNTPDNYAIAALATSDLLIGIVYIPVDLVHFNDEELFNKSRLACILDFFCRYFLLCSSISFLMLLTLDRYTAIAFPYFYHTTLTNSMVVWAACGLCVFNFFLFVGFPIYLVETYLEVKKNGNIECDVKFFPDWFLLVATALVGLYVLISMLATIGVVKHACRSLSHRWEVEKRFANSERTTKKHKQLRMTIIMNFLFIVLVLPSIISSSIVRRIDDINRKEIVTAICNHLLLLNSSVNAGVYAMSRPIYRNSFVYILTHSPWNWGDLSHDVLRENALKNFRSSLVSQSSMVTRTISTMNRPDEVKNLVTLPEKQRSTSVDTGTGLADTTGMKLEKRLKESVKHKNAPVAGNSNVKNLLYLPKSEKGSSVDTGTTLTDTTTTTTTTTETTTGSSSTGGTMIK